MKSSLKTSVARTRPSSKSSTRTRNTPHKRVNVSANAASRGVRRGRPRKTHQTESAQERILDAAEELFAKHGFYGVTTRDVAKQAGVDSALLHYYFRNKRGMFDKVFGRRAEILNRLRMESFDRYESEAGGRMTLEGVIDAFLRPLFDTVVEGVPGWHHYFALMAHVNNAPVWGGATMTRYFDPVIHRFIGLLRKLLPKTSVEDLNWSYQQLSGALTLTLAQTGRIDRLSGGLCRSSDLKAAYARMVPYAVGGLRNVSRRRRT